MNATLEQLREIVKQADQVDQARRLLPQLEEQARLERQRDQAAANVPLLDQALTEALQAYLVARDANHRDFQAWLEQGKAILKRKAELDRAAGGVIAKARALAENEFLAGFARSPVARQDATAGRAVDTIRARLGGGDLSAYTPTISAGGYTYPLLDFLEAMTPRPRPALSAEQAIARSVETTQHYQR